MDTSGRQISVVTPVYNPGGYFPACLASLEAQMKKAAQMLEYEIAAQLRDEIIRLRGK